MCNQELQHPSCLLCQSHLMRSWTSIFNLEKFRLILLYTYYAKKPIQEWAHWTRMDSNQPFHSICFFFRSCLVFVISGIAFRVCLVILRSERSGPFLFLSNSNVKSCLKQWWFHWDLNKTLVTTPKIKKLHKLTCALSLPCNRLHALEDHTFWSIRSHGTAADAVLYKPICCKETWVIK
jgi:hypothetical protein